MLCRALLATVVLSYVLCVLLLSGVQKEDLDEGTLRKLQRHNVNIDDINDQKLQEQCLGRTNPPITLATVTTEISTEKTITPKEILETEKSVGSLVADTTPLEKIVEYLENKYKDQRIKTLDSKDKTIRSQFELTPITTLPPSTSWHDRYQKIEFENFRTDKSVVAFSNKDDEKSNMNKEMENLMRVWQTNIDRISDTTQQESSTTNIIKDEHLSKNTKDVEYISKIVAEIMSKRQLDEGKSSVSAQYDLNETFRDATQTSSVNIKNVTVLPTNYYLNNCNLGNFYASKQGEKEKDETLNNLYNQQGYSGNMPNTETRTNNNIYMACKRVEELKDNILLHAVSVHDNTLNHIISKLKKASQGFNEQDNENAKAFGTSLENHLKSLPFNQQNSNNNYKERLNILDNESAKALETVLENQSKKNIFNKQSDPINTNNTYKERFNLFDYENTKVYDTTTDQPKSIFYYPTIETTNVNKEKQANYARFVEENRNFWEKYIESLSNTQEPKLEDDQTQIIIKTPNDRNKITKQGDNTEYEEYKRWLYTFHKPLIKQEATIGTKQNSLLNSRPDEYEKQTNILNTIHQDSNFGYQYRRPWLYGGQSSEQPKSRIKGKQERILFKPKKYEKIMNTNDPRPKNIYGPKIPPYFIPLPKNLSTISIQEREMPENNRDVVDNSDRARLRQLNYWGGSREVIGANKKPANFVGWYQNKTPFIMEDRDSKQFESNRDKEISQSRQTNHQNKIMSVPEAEYKRNLEDFRNKQRQKQNSNEEHGEETDYYMNSKSSKQYNYQYPLRPYKIPAKIPSSKVYAAKNQFTDFISKENENKLPTLSANVIKDIANSIKEIVLRDLKTTTVTETTPCTTISTKTTAPTTTTDTTTSSTTTTTSAITTKPTSTTTTPPTTITTPTTTKSTTTGSLIITAKEDPLRVQDASKAMEKLMEMFEKISSMKDKVVKLDSVKNIHDVRYDTKATATNQLIFQTQEQAAQFIPENRVPYALHQTQMKVVNRIGYDHHPVQLNDENRIAYDAPTVQSKPENVIPYTQPLIKRTPENSIPRYGMKTPYKTPYYSSKIEYNPYVENEVLLSATQKAKIKKVGHAITVQTNSGEIAPLKIELQKPMIQNIVLTTNPPITDASSDEIVNFRKPISSMARHKVDDNRQAEVGNKREHKSYVARPTHRDAFIEQPKSRKIKKQRGFAEEYKPRGIQEIERFHEKLERGDDWNPYKEAIPKRMQRPLAKKANYDDTHFRNFLHTQQKVNAMLEQILGSAKTTPFASAEIISPT